MGVGLTGRELRTIGKAMFMFGKLTVISLTWLIAVVASIAAGLLYDFRPSSTIPTLRQWPIDSRLSRVEDKPTLILFAHPRCPCTVATLEELAEILNGIDQSLTINIVFVVPTNAGAQWHRSKSVQLARQIPDACVTFDTGASYRNAVSCDDVRPSHVV